MTYGVMDLFSGIGGFSLGLERTGGFRTTSFCEIDPYCRRVLAKHWPDVPCHPDITKCEYREGEADVITAGFPCQDISFAGLGAGLAGARSGLWREVVRAVRLVRPVYVLLENVSALLGRGMGRVLGDMAASGYDTEWDCIPASAIGAPHRRDRVWIIANHAIQRRRDEPASDTRTGDPVGRPQVATGRLRGDEAMAYAHSDGRESRRESDAAQISRGWQSDRGGIGPHDMADAELRGREGRNAPRSILRSGAVMPSGWWLTEPNLGRSHDGIPAELDGDSLTAAPWERGIPRAATPRADPHHVDRLRGLGNAVVPQIPELLGNAILSAPR